MNTIYIGNLPSNLSQDILERYFFLCGPIISKQTQINNFLDNEDKRAYAFITFEKAESVTKATFFNCSLLGENELLIRKADEILYKASLGGLPPGFEESYAKEVLDAVFGKYAEIELNLNKNNQQTLIVSFYDEDTRKLFIDMQEFSQEMAVVIEPKLAKKTEKKEGNFKILIKNIPFGIDTQFLQDMFRLCGRSDVYIEPSENNLTIAFITLLTKAGADKAIKFNNSIVTGWPVPISVSNSFNEHNPFLEYKYIAIVKNFGKKKKLKDIEDILCPTIGNIRVVRPENHGEKHFVYANFKEEADLEQALKTSNRINLGGNGPATIVRKTNQNHEVEMPNSLEDLQKFSISQNDKFVRFPLATTINEASWTIDIRSDRDIDSTTVQRIVSSMGTIDSISKRDKMYTIKLNVKL